MRSALLKKDEETYATTFPSGPKGVDALVRGLRRGETRCVEPMLTFLEADPYTYGSGYAKESAWRSLARVELSASQKRRLMQVALHYVAVRSSREFFPMCRFVNRIADASFVEDVTRLAETSTDHRQRQRASLLAAYLKGTRLGELTRMVTWWDYFAWRSRKSVLGPVTSDNDHRAFALELLRDEERRLEARAASAVK